MRAEFFRPEAPDEVLAVVAWDGRSARIETADQTVREALERVFRPSPLVAADAASRPAGRTGETVLEPGDLDWFRGAAIVRGDLEGFAVRFVSETAGGWDPAGAYRSMRAWVADRETSPTG
jgi:hypothetical protein